MIICRLLCCAVVISFSFPQTLLPQSRPEKILIRAPKPYSSLVRAIQARGGRVTREFRYVDGVAAEVPRSALDAINALTGGAVSKDLVVPNPAPVDTLRRRNFTRRADEKRLRSSSVQTLSSAQIASLAAVNPNSYVVNNGAANASALHARGIAGQGVVVAVIDSGIRPGFPHISLDGSVIGCEDFVDDGLGCSNFANDGHGTFVAGMISANVAFGFSSASEFRNAVFAECANCFVDSPVNTIVPMVGTAPLASIYALRVLPPVGGSPVSRIIAAVERVMELREKYERGELGGVNIGVCNMSLGGSTLFAGHDLLSQTVDLLLQKDIVPVIAASNAGPATLTIGSPGSAINALTVGAASLALNERILWLTQDPVNGGLFRPFPGAQTAYFSSRGPNADGRPDPEVVANGVACFGQGMGDTTDSISLGSGTSFAAPSVAGVAALLRQGFPGLNARKIRNAIVLSANANLLADGSGELDRGKGYVDARAAYDLLLSRDVPNTLPDPGEPTRLVGANLQLGSGLTGRTGFVQERISNLKPGQRRDILYHVPPNASQLTIILTNVIRALPPHQQNRIFGDDILLAVHSAKTSSIGEAGDYPIFTFTTGGSYIVPNPEFGLLRVSVNGDWTNAGAVSADVVVFSSPGIAGPLTLESMIVQGQALLVPFFVPSGTHQIEARVSWTEDWSNYPANDLDLILIGPGGIFDFTGATLSNPESATIANPVEGVWLALVDAFQVNTRRDRAQLRVTVDGALVH